MAVSANDQGMIVNPTESMNSAINPARITSCATFVRGESSYRATTPFPG